MLQHNPHFLSGISIGIKWEILGSENPHILEGFCDTERLSLPTFVAAFFCDLLTLFMLSVVGWYCLQMGNTAVLAAGIDSPVAAAQQAVAAFLEDGKNASKEAKLKAADEAEAQGDMAQAAALRAEFASNKVLNVGLSVLRVRLLECRSEVVVVFQLFFANRGPELIHVPILVFLRTLFSCLLNLIIIVIIRLMACHV